VPRGFFDVEHGFDSVSHDDKLQRETRGREPHGPPKLLHSTWDFISAFFRVFFGKQNPV
jgi:hypothetical protein